jgi:hypothetical protein
MAVQLESPNPRAPIGPMPDAERPGPPLLPEPHAPPVPPTFPVDPDERRRRPMPGPVPAKKERRHDPDFRLTAEGA